MGVQRQRRVSKTALIYIPVGTVLVVVLTILGISSFMRILDIEVVGATRYLAEDIVAASGINSGDNLMFLDTDSAERRIISSLPFVSSATIVRYFPDRLKIEITESTPIAYLSSGAVLLVIDADARIVEIVTVRPAGLIEIRGITPVDPVEGGLLRSDSTGDAQVVYLRNVLVAMERENLLADVQFLDMSSILHINFGYLNRFTINLGGPSNLRQKLFNVPYAVERANLQYDETVEGDIDLSNIAERGFFRARH